MSRLAAALLVATIAVASGAGCGAGRSQIGPYVKTLARNGEWLVVTRCVIVLDDEELREQSCTTAQVPLRSLPPAPTAPAAAQAVLAP